MCQGRVKKKVDVIKRYICQLKRKREREREREMGGGRGRKKEEKERLRRSTHKQHSKHGLTDVEGMTPVVVGDRTVVLLHSAQPSADHLKQQQQFIPQAAHGSAIKQVLPSNKQSTRKSNHLALMTYQPTQLNTLL